MKRTGRRPGWSDMDDYGNWIDGDDTHVSPGEITEGHWTWD